MITDDHGVHWGTARELVDHIGGDLTIACVRNWAARGELPKARTHTAAGRVCVRYPLPVAAELERDKRYSPRGRKRGT